MVKSVQVKYLSLRLLSHMLPLMATMHYACAASTPEPTRVLGLQGAPNFRDVGGYSTSDGHQVRWGLVYRSSKLSALTPADETKLQDLHIASEVDLRTAQERNDEPDRWLQPPADIYRSPKASIKPLIGELLAGVDDAKTARHSMETLYGRLPDAYRPEYAALFERLAKGSGPILVHCTAGKDRTGVAIAILLTELGVPRQTVISDYTMSEELLRQSSTSHANSPGPNRRAATMPKIPIDAQVEFERSEPSYIEAALDSVIHEFGSVNAYLKGSLGLSDMQIASLKHRLIN